MWEGGTLPYVLAVCPHETCRGCLGIPVVPWGFLLCPGQALWDGEGQFLSM